MRRLTLPAVVLLLAFVAGCSRTDDTVIRPAFVERIRPAVFAAAELAFEEPFSREYDLVFLRTDFARPVSALALRRDETDDYTLYFGSGDTDGTWHHVTTSLNPDVGRQVMRAVEFKLHRNVLVNGQLTEVTRNEGDLWVHLRLADGTPVAALIPLASTLGNDEAAVFLNDFLGALQRLPAAEPEERPDLLTRIDQLATAIIFAEEATAAEPAKR